MSTPHRRPTATSAFGVSGRQSHDASRFYAQFPKLVLSKDENVQQCPVTDRLFVGDSRHMQRIPDSCVALMVTSPPYFAAKEYELARGEGHIPGSYVEYLEMLHDVLAETYRVLEPGGRAAVNVANLGRRPYRSLSADVTRIMEGLGYLPRGEIIWRKAAGASGSCAWGSFCQPTNPVLRDLTERIIVMGKGRFDRAIKPKKRATMGLPHEATISKEEFMAATLDVWDIPPASATRVGHPAPFPVALPLRLIQLHTFRTDVVLDPFIGSGTTAVACVQAGRHFVGYDTDPQYVELAEKRIAEAQATL